jgi:hypothetical protein
VSGGWWVIGPSLAWNAGDVQQGAELRD